MTSDHLFSLEGRTILVSGASSGIGLGLCRAFAERAATVVAVSRSAPDSVDLARLADDHGGRVHRFAVDVSSAESVAAGLERIAGVVDRVDVLVNNAGVSSESLILARDVDEWHRTIGANLTGPYLLTSGVASRMVEAGRGGSIVNVSSIAAHRAVKGLAAYAASKAGLEQLTRVAAVELAPHGIRVNGIVPGYVRSGMNAGYLDAGAGERLARRIPLGRVGQPADIEGAAVFLASAASAYVTGTVIAVDGGFLL
ncbi:SDR family NAD(P)-dependent oxidoreductase [Phytohabitans kaempferiae]|uniref:SDR family NAD(P)-dependent oxidoreductase n=1 Tax=Phytohabitans kaempferiae TaxID=1620943 RepID=A0ABV6M5L6_9ACTN